MNKREFGNELESFACKRLKDAGCEIVTTNFNCKLGEIDIIAYDAEVLTFIEVRYRRLESFGGASASVDINKQRKLIKAASLYLQQTKLTNKVACRFDVFAIRGEIDRLEYDWLKNAFTA